jgi:hypothetical protein
MITKVQFRVFRDDNSVIAIFPEIPGDANDPYTCQSYMHVGQHGPLQAPNPLTRPASPEEYESLKRELESAPFNYRLQVVQKISQKMHRLRREKLNVV